MRFLNPRTDYAFKKIFGSEQSHDILISFLNAILNLTGEDVIVAVTINDPYQPPKLGGMKDTFLDVKVTDQRGQMYLVEMQVLNTIGFEKRVLYNACKAYVNQLGRGEMYRLLKRVVAVTITDFVLFPELQDYVTYFELRAQENTAVCYPDLALVFAELTKFQLTEAELTTPLERWLYFMKTARGLTHIPPTLATEPAIVHALELADRINWSEIELDDAEKREMWLADQQYLKTQLEAAEKRRIEEEQRRVEAEQRRVEAEQRRVEAEQQRIEEEQRRIEAERRAVIAEQRAAIAEQRGLTDGVEQGRLDEKRALLLRLLQWRFDPLSAALMARIETASAMQLDQWVERCMTATTMTDIFGGGE